MPTIHSLSRQPRTKLQSRRAKRTRPGRCGQPILAWLRAHPCQLHYRLSTFARSRGAHSLEAEYTSGVSASHPVSSAAKPTLRRCVGLSDLTALGINQVIGGGIFLIPAPIAANIGSWGPVGFIVAGLAMLLIALCYAETGSRFSDTGGAYLYARAAFGKFIGFEVGWMQWFVRVSSQAAIVSGIAAAISYYWTEANRGWGKALIVSSITLLIGYLHTTGIRQSALAIRFFTVGKLAPLSIFIVAGLCMMDSKTLPSFPAVSPHQAAAAGFMLAFAFGGFETIPVICGEAKNPRRDVVYALIATLICVTLVMSLVQLVYVSSSRGITESATPLADSAGLLMGSAGAAVIGIGSLISMFGANVGSSLAASRMLFAFAENEDSPPAVGPLARAIALPL
ncbi:MAG: APC family permease [Betaproteobacteria bacterium]|nr:APC family permease [Betaproteobacteria bacterium]MBM3726718.1 APC family permease [Acidobacteriota bacterium]